jgi:uncharacterized protein YprB with RNaseH-like and TPR domain
VAANLKARLTRLRGLGLVKNESGAKGIDVPPSFLSDWERVADLLWTRTLRFPSKLGTSLNIEPFLARCTTRLPDRARGKFRGVISIPRAEFRFFDLETTGLSGGTGTVAFLAAVGREDEESFAVKQFFLEDYPGESGFVESLAAELRGRIVVTYNGRAFDLPLLRTRCVMNALAPPELTDIDALYCARRLWSRVHGGASLGLLEREVLGIEREEDVPGSAIPDIWFEYLRRGDHPLMRIVMSHNASDVASLASLVERAGRAFAEPGKLAASSAIDRAGLGRILLSVGRGLEGEELLEASAGDGDEAAGLFLSRRYRRDGRVDDRRRVLAMLPTTTYPSCVERAKFYEHAMRDFDTALSWARAAEALTEGDRESEAISARLERLERKAARAKNAGTR